MYDEVVALFRDVEKSLVKEPAGDAGEDGASSGCHGPRRRWAAAGSTKAELQRSQLLHHLAPSLATTRLSMQLPAAILI